MTRRVAVDLGGPGEPVSRTFTVELHEGPAEVVVAGCPCRVDDFALLAPSTAKGATQAAFAAWVLVWKRQADRYVPPPAPAKPCGCKDPKT